MESERVSKFIDLISVHFAADLLWRRILFFLKISHNHYKMDFVYRQFWVCYLPICVAE